MKLWTASKNFSSSELGKTVISTARVAFAVLVVREMINFYLLNRYFRSLQS